MLIVEALCVLLWLAAMVLVHSPTLQLRILNAITKHLPRKDKK